MSAAPAAAQAQRVVQPNQIASASQAVVRFHSHPDSTCVLQKQYEQAFPFKMKTGCFLILGMPMSLLEGLMN